MQKEFDRDDDDSASSSSALSTTETASTLCDCPVDLCYCPIVGLTATRADNLYETECALWCLREGWTRGLVAHREAYDALISICSLDTDVDALEPGWAKLLLEAMRLRGRLLDEMTECITCDAKGGAAVRGPVVCRECILSGWSLQTAADIAAIVNLQN
jgi:hypothetical protein